MTQYDTLNRTFERAQVLMEAAETQGILCGLLCTTDAKTAKTYWLQHILTDSETNDALVQECQKALNALFQQTEQALSQAASEFTLLLPDDAENLPYRVQTLGTWCEGFLFGLSIGGLSANIQLPKNIQEFLQDVINISHVAPLETDAEQEEAHYFQLVEYLRIGVQTWYENDELNQLCSLTNAIQHGVKTLYKS